MDGKQFDALVRHAVAMPRRRVLGGVVGGVLGSAGVFLGWQKATAGPYENRGERCSGNNPCNAPCRACCPEYGNNRRCVYGCNDALEVCNASRNECVPRIGGTGVPPRCF